MENNSFRKRESILSFILYHLLKILIVNPLFLTYFRGRIYGQENIPKGKSVIIVSNHSSYFDPPLLSSCINRPVAFMAKEELFKVPVLAQAMRLYGAYPVKRETGDRGAIKSALNALRDGWLVGIFIQGTRTYDGNINHPKLGAAMIASKTQTLLLPVSLWGTNKVLRKGSYFPMPVPITIRIGKPINPPQSNKRQELKEVTQECATRINYLNSLGR
ncbi:lysophospholipid acyltransferase family protein [Candidatus Atelocyanobacterium thalassae]|uniref:1-acyl-sn-glycerol-3-phosphate acyltransferase n=1 Tax=cyanobacterium endosymbiont of Braarudosphaera bigelowii TaxID=1285375 RepID=A0ABM7U6R3_9CHRO|nr:lysophospholipid acyltransferase family protein [Candidatus Atelocyanobacterium thalassa]BDA40334.1 1-acyl-sn-glycerol-3-phosphate acyltransferase [cyanobacterium endosymbiont of Braarudosphaera bigelowii]